LPGTAHRGGKAASVRAQLIEQLAESALDAERGRNNLTGHSREGCGVFRFLVQPVAGGVRHEAATSPSSHN